jgi:hypothetical protein
VIRADLLYERLRYRQDLNPLQLRLVYLVHARKMRMRVIEVRIAAVSGMNEGNQKLLTGLTDDYFEMMFPGVDSSKANTFEEQAKKLLAEEMKNVYRVRRITDQAELDAETERLIGSGMPGGSVLAQAEKDKMLEKRVPSQLRKRS